MADIASNTVSLKFGKVVIWYMALLKISIRFVFFFFIDWTEA